MPADPVFVTAFSMNHFEEGMALIRNFNKYVSTQYPKAKLFVYNLGLSLEQTVEVSHMGYLFRRCLPRELI